MQKHIWPLISAKHNSEDGRQYGFYSSSQNKFELNVMQNSTGVILWLYSGEEGGLDQLGRRPLHVWLR